MKVRLGAHKPCKKKTDFPYEDYRVRSIMIHEDHHAERLLRRDSPDEPNDIALIELHETVTFKKHIAPICLPDKHADFSGSSATVTGWTMKKALQKDEVLVLRNNACEKDFIASGHPFDTFIPRSQLCTEFTNHTATCDGGEGAPLAVERNGRAYIIGITSWQFGCYQPNKLSIYTNVASFVDWIHKKIGAKHR